MIAQRNRPKIYLAGPDVFRADAAGVGGNLKDLARLAGFEPLWPLDGDTFVAADEITTPAQYAKRIFSANAQLIQRADCVLANIEPFRGPGMDAGTAWEIGCAWAWNKPVFAYVWQSSTYAERVAAEHGVTKLPPIGEELRSPCDGMAIENFGLAENLMIACSVDRCTVSFGATSALLRAAQHFKLADAELTDPDLERMARGDLR